MMFKKLQKLISTNDESIWSEFYETLEAEGYIDGQYMEHTSGQEIEEAIRNVSSMSLEDVCAWLTWILRGERFCDGLFQSCIDDGTISALLDRGDELLKVAENEG